VGEAAELIDRSLKLPGELGQQGSALGGVVVGDVLSPPEIDREGNEVVLGAVVQIPLDAAPLGVGGCD
jgi:hypothetical protein